MTVERSFFKMCLVAILDVVICFLLLLTASSSLAWDYVVGRGTIVPRSTGRCAVIEYKDDDFELFFLVFKTEGDKWGFGSSTMNNLSPEYVLP